MRRSLTNVLVGGIVAWTIFGCGGGAGSPIGSARPGNGQAPGGSAGTGQAVAPVGPFSTIDSCTLLNDQEIEAATGQGVSERQPSTLTQVFPSVCDIELDDGGSLTIRVLPSGGRNMYETSFEPYIGQSEMPPLDEAVAGLGDKAGISGDDELMVLKDDVLFDVFYIEFGRQNKEAILHYLAERILAKLPCLASGCPDMTLPPPPTGGAPVDEPTLAAVDPGSLPSTGAQARVVNLYSESSQPIDVDVYAYGWSDSQMHEVPSLVATASYGQASEWFNPGLVETSFSEDPYTRVEIYRHGEQDNPLVSVGEFLGAGTVTTIMVWQEEVYEGQPGAWVGTVYAEHPDYPVPQSLPDKGLLVSRNSGLNAEADPPTLQASVGDGCLESPIARSIPDIPNVQPLGNDLALPLGEHMLTVHEDPVGELPTCEGKALGPGAPISVSAGDRILALPYRLPGTSEINLLVLPFDN